MFLSKAAGVLTSARANDYSNAICACYPSPRLSLLLVTDDVKDVRCLTVQQGKSNGDCVSSAALSETSGKARVAVDGGPCRRSIVMRLAAMTIGKFCLARLSSANSGGPRRAEPHC
jgi:hypothetical protein